MGQEAPEKDPRAVSEEPAEAPSGSLSVSQRRSWATNGVAERKAIPWNEKGEAPRGAKEPEWTPEQERVVAELYEKALAGEIPRSRELKYWEPERLSERHLSMIMMRVSGVHQRLVAKAFGATDSNVSIVLNHPDAQYIMSRLMAIRATHTNDIEKRLGELAGPSMSVLEDVILSDDPDTLKVALRKSPSAFKILEANGHFKPKKVESTNTQVFRLESDATPAQISELTRAIREARMLRDGEYVSVGSQEEMRALLEGADGAEAAGNSDILPPDGEVGGSTTTSTNENSSNGSADGSDQTREGPS